jgi:hypothetical protein
MPFRAIFPTSSASSSSSFSSLSRSSAAGYHRIKADDEDEDDDDDDDDDFFGAAESLTSSGTSTSSSDRKKKKEKIKKKTRRNVPVVLLQGALPDHSHDRILSVDPHVLEHPLFQDLLSKSTPLVPRRNARKHCQELQGIRGGHGLRDHLENAAIAVNCDAILFEFLIWLVENNDPSLRDLDLNDLMEFYGPGESG